MPCLLRLLLVSLLSCGVAFAQDTEKAEKYHRLLLKKPENPTVFDRFVGLLNREFFHVQGTAFIFISLDKQSEAVFAEFEIAVAQLEQVMECYLMAGDNDYMLKVVYSDAKDYEELYYKKILRLPGCDRKKIITDLLEEKE